MGWGLLLTYFAVGVVAGGIKGAIRPAGGPVKQVLAYSMACGLTAFVTGLAGLRWIGAEDPYLILLLVTLAGWLGPDILERAAQIAAGRFGARLGQEAPP